MKITFDTGDYKTRLQALGLNATQVRRELASTIRTVSREYRRETATEIAVKFKIKKAPFVRARAKAKQRRGSRFEYTVFQGLNSVKMSHFIGATKPVQTKLGTTVAGEFFPKAFAAKMPSGKWLAVRRDRPGERTGETAPAWVRNHPVYKLNLPIDEMKKELIGADAIVEKHFLRLPVKIEKVMQRRLQILIDKKIRG